ncbi:MAG: hypothetical protein LBV49_11110 [Azonexus sp.]|jgi:hypothetical protein|nr:hypothetical protein [Azonexus sp.]
MTAPQSLIANFPFEPPRWHCPEYQGSLKLTEGCRPAGYESFDSGHNTRRAALDAWAKAVNRQGGFGVWCCDVAFAPEQIQDILATHG